MSKNIYIPGTTSDEIIDDMLTSKARPSRAELEALRERSVLEACRVERDVSQLAEVLDRVAQAYGKHSGPGSTDNERAAFRHDLQVAAVRYALAKRAMEDAR